MTTSGRPAPVRLLVVDDQTSIREALATMLGLDPSLEVVGTAGDGEEALARAAQTAPDVVLMDLRMPVLGGAEATARLLADRPEVAVVVLTTYDDDASVLAALDAGAAGYLTKDASRGEIAAAVLAAAAGQSVLDRGVQQRLLAAARRGAGEPGPAPMAPATDPALEALTPREREVLRLIAAGLSNRELARRLVVSEATVKTHVNNLFAKTGVRDRAQAVHWAYAHGVAAAELPD